MTPGGLLPKIDPVHLSHTVLEFYQLDTFPYGGRPVERLSGLDLLKETGSTVTQMAKETDLFPTCDLYVI